MLKLAQNIIFEQKIIMNYRKIFEDVEIELRIQQQKTNKQIAIILFVIALFLSVLPAFCQDTGFAQKTRRELRHERKMQRIENKNHRIELIIASGRFNDSIRHMEEVAEINADYAVRIAKINRNIERIQARVVKSETKQTERTKRMDKVVWIALSVAICLFLLLLILIILKNRK